MFIHASSCYKPLPFFLKLLSWTPPLIFNRWPSLSEKTVIIRHKLHPLYYLHVSQLSLLPFCPWGGLAFLLKIKTLAIFLISSLLPSFLSPFMCSFSQCSLRALECWDTLNLRIQLNKTDESPLLMDFPFYCVASKAFLIFTSFFIFNMFSQWLFCFSLQICLTHPHT